MKFEINSIGVQQNDLTNEIKSKLLVDYLSYKRSQSSVFDSVACVKAYIQHDVWCKLSCFAVERSLPKLAVY